MGDKTVFVDDEVKFTDSEVLWYKEMLRLAGGRRVFTLDNSRRSFVMGD